jgi:Holliday junction resolvase RusA-like endonuclease
VKLHIPIDPMPCPRPRVSRHHTYMPKKYVEWQEAVQAELLFQCSPQFEDVPVRVNIKLHKVRPNGDLDNYAKAILDCLVASGVIPDDSCKYLTAVSCSVLQSKKGGFTVEVIPA